MSSTYPGPRLTLSEQGRRLLEADEDRHAEAIEVLRHSVAAGERDGPALLARGYLERGQRREAAEVLAPQVEAGRTDLAGFLAEVLAGLGQDHRAEQAYLVALDAGDVAAMVDYGVFLRYRGRPLEAAYLFDRAARAGDEVAPMHLVAVHLEALDDLPAARAAAEAYADERRPATLIGLADVRMATGQTDEAEWLYRRAAALGAPRAHLVYGWFLQDVRGDLVGAEREYRLAQRASEPGWANNLGRFLLDTGRSDEAREVLEYGAYWGDDDARAALDDLDGIDPTDD